MGLRDRPGDEREELTTLMRESVEAPEKRVEVEQMKATIADVIRKEGRQEGRQEGRLIALREMLVMLLTEKFGALPPEVVESIEGSDDAARLEAAVGSVLKVKSLGDFSI
mgnify:CR=1 FL=1